VFVDLTAAYDTVWHRGFACKLLRLLLDRHMVRTIMYMVGNCNFTLITGNGAGCDVSRMASHRHLSFSSTSLTCQAPSAESMHMLTTMHADVDW